MTAGQAADRDAPGDAAVDEAARVAALHRYDVLDQPVEVELTALVAAAAAVAGVPTATLNLIDTDRLCMLTTVGLDGADSPRSEAMCQIGLARGAFVHLTDATLDPRYVANPWVDGTRGAVRFYASAPLTTPDGHVIGTLCVVDDVPKTLLPHQVEALEGLAAVVVSLFERRRELRVTAGLAALAEHRRQLTDVVLDRVDVGIVACDADGRLTLFNATARAWHGVDADPAVAPDRLAGHYDLRTEDGSAALRSDEIPLLRALHEGHVEQAVFTLAVQGRPARTLEASGRALHRTDGAVDGAVVVMSDVTAARRLARANAAALRRHQVLVDVQQRVAAAELVPRTVESLICSGVREVTGATGVALLREEDGTLGVRSVLGTPLGDGSVVDRDLALRALDQRRIVREPARASTAGVPTPPGDRYDVAIPLLDGGEPVGCVVVRAGLDEAVREEHADELAALASTCASALVNAWRMHHVSRSATSDALTGLPNRTAAVQVLERALARQDGRGGHVAVLFLDLDGFKLVNDTFGHHAGDEVLVRVADRIRATLRTTDTPCRYGGDEFLVVAEGLSEPDDAHRLAGRLVSAISGDYDLVQGAARIGTSIGVAIAGAPEPGRRSVVDRATALLMTADEAMYDDKETRRARR